MGIGNFWGLLPHWKALEVFAAVYAKTAEPIEMPFEGRARMGESNQEL